MKKAMVVAATIILVVGVASFAHAKVGFLLEINPLNLLVSPDAEDFEVSNGLRTEEFEGSSSWIPNIKAGVGFDFSSFYLDLYGGVGYLWNNVFNSTYFLGDAALLFKTGNSGRFCIGPHASVISFSPSWDGVADADMDSTLGWLGGIKFVVGSKVVRFAASVDYLSAEFDVTGRNGWVPNKDKLDMSGLGIQLGVSFRF